MLACTASLRVSALLLAATCLLPASPPGALAANSDEACTLALSAQRYALDVQASITGRTVPQVAQLEGYEAPSADVIQASREALGRLLNRPGPSNLITAFHSQPYGISANHLYQTAMSQAVHTPAAALGEMMYVANSLEQLVLQHNGSLPNEEAWEAWTATWGQLGDALLKQVDDMEGKLSQRSLLQRSLTYHWLAYYPQPASALYEEVYDKATETFQRVLEMYNAYSTTLFRYPYSNGTAEGDLDAILVTAVPGVKRPLMVVVGNAHVWKELQFMRYGLGALRRYYAVLLFDQPGQGHALRRPPYFSQTSNFTYVMSSILDIIKGDKRLSQHVDLNKVVLVGVSLGSYSAADAAAGLGDRIAALVVDPGITSLSDRYLTFLSRSLYSTMQLVAADNGTLLPDSSLVQAFKDPLEQILYPLLMACREDSGAPQLLSTAFEWLSLPHVYYASATVLGLHLHSPQ